MKFRIMLVLLVLVTPTVVNALGLGKLELQSALNQPFKARIKLLSATADEFDSLKVSLADQKAFDRAGIQRIFLLSRLRFAIQESETGPDYIQIRSNEAIREPFLNFLLEINWSKGRLFREYTVLLDPPAYTTSIGKKQAVVHPETPVAGIDSSDHQVVYDLEYKPESRSRVSEPVQETPRYEATSSYDEPTTINYSGSGDYGPAVTGDTLWSIAKAARPDSSVSIQQMMLAILNANPDAFIENNINGLKRGAILQIPDASEANSLDQSDALAQAKNQNALWDEYKGHVSDYVSQQPESSGGYGQTSEAVADEPGEIEQDSSVTDIEEADEAELRLISESEQGSGSDQSSVESTGVDVDALNNDLALANESIEALYQENAELKDKLTETEGIIDDLKRLIVLKEDELAAMQEQIMVAAAEVETVIEEEAEEELVEEVEVEEVEEELVEEDAEEEIEFETTEPEELIVEDVTPSDDSGLGDLFGLMGLLEKAKANLMIIGSAVGGLILLVFLMVFASKRRSAKATVIDLPADDFPDFGDDYEDETVKADTISEEDSESITVVPGSEDETILPGDDSAGDDDSFDVPDIPNIPEESSPAPVAAIEDDPMEEVNVFLAYEHFDEAESFVRKALESEPENLDFHSKLLEVFYAANNKKSYEEEARVVHDKTGGQGEHWDMATVMWQEISPNRALFEAPAEGEDGEDSAESTSSGVLNIAAESDASSDTGDINIADETGEDVLDVTAAADIDSIPSEADDSGGDMDFSLDNDDAMELSADESNELLDDTIQMQATDVNQLQQTEEVLDVTTAIDSEEDVSESSDEDLLDVSIAQDSGGANELDISFGDSTGADADADLLGESADTEEATASAGELDIDFGDSTGADADADLLGESAGTEEATASAGELDIDFGDSTGADAGLDLLGESAGTEEATASAGELDIDFGDSTGADAGLDLLGESADTEEATASAGELDIDFGDSTGADAGLDLLDDSADEEKASGGESDDLLDVTSAINFESEGSEDLLDVTATASAEDIDAKDLMESSSSDGAILDTSASEKSEFDSGPADDVDLDLSLSTGDDSLDISLDSDLVDDIESETGDEDSGDLDFDLVIDDADDNELVDLEIDSSEEMNDLDMESTVQMPSANVDALSMLDEKEEGDDDDKTFLVPKSSDVDEQSEDEEMASQLDLAKAYIELGDNENAKTILDEIISQGSDTYRKQAEELMEQIN
jgi:pilus assembly protein FimV